MLLTDREGVLDTVGQQSQRSWTPEEGGPSAVEGHGPLEVPGFASFSCP